MHLMTGKLNLNNVIRAVIDRPYILWLSPHKWATNGRPYELQTRYFDLPIPQADDQWSPLRIANRYFDLPIPQAGDQWSPLLL